MPNRSSIKTKKKIKEAFASLIQEKESMANITVTELANLADITRATFYTHYENIYQVAKDIQDEALELLKVDLNNFSNLSDIDNYFDSIVKHLKENDSIYRMILASREPLIFMDRISKLLQEKISAYLNPQNDKTTNLKITFFIDGSMNLFIRYYRGDLSITLDEICNFIKLALKKTFLEEDN